MCASGIDVPLASFRRFQVGNLLDKETFTSLPSGIMKAKEHAIRGLSLRTDHEMGKKMQKEDCIFCKIANGEISTTMVYETEDLAAFNDAAPMMPVHVLIVPKDHYESLSDDVPADILSKLMKAAPEVAKLTGIYESGYRTLINTGDDAGQTVKHLHVHVLGGGQM